VAWLDRYLHLERDVVAALVEAMVLDALEVRAYAARMSSLLVSDAITKHARDRAGGSTLPVDALSRLLQRLLRDSQGRRAHSPEFAVKHHQVLRSNAPKASTFAASSQPANFPTPQPPQQQQQQHRRRVRHSCTSLHPPSMPHGERIPSLPKKIDAILTILVSIYSKLNLNPTSLLRVCVWGYLLALEC
jgi:hypothetical protein